MVVVENIMHYVLWYASGALAAPATNRLLKAQKGTSTQIE